MTGVSGRTSFSRAEALRRLADETFDVLVIGGGITGAGVALDAASRGLKVALVEARDLASGTSSKSSKLVHGGLRYLQQKEYLLVYENLAERQRLLENAPHLVEPLPFLIPLFGKDGVVSKTVAKAYRTALWLYDLTGGVRIGKRHKRITREEARAHLPHLRTDRLVAGFIYYDARADDARLTLTIARTAVLGHDAVVATYTPVVRLVKDGAGRVRGAEVAPVGGEPFTVTAGCVVNAAGVWAAEVGALDAPGVAGPLRPAKGVHVTVPLDKVGADIAAVLPVPKDRRSIFVVPWGDKVYLGTTDTDYQGSLEDPTCTDDDVRYLLDAYNFACDRELTPEDVTGTWAGLRPLLAEEGASERTADLSRRHKVSVSEGGLVSITGGKLTTYRAMAEHTVDEVVRQLGRGAKKSRTKKLRLHGAEGVAGLRQPGAAARLGVSEEVLDHLVRRYGSDARTVVAIVEADPELGKPLVEGLPYLRAEAVFAARYEMATTVDDVLARRTRALLLDAEATRAVVSDVAHLLAVELGWSPADVDREIGSALR